MSPGLAGLARAPKFWPRPAPPVCGPARVPRLLHLSSSYHQSLSKSRMAGTDYHGWNEGAPPHFKWLMEREHWCACLGRCGHPASRPSQLEVWLMFRTWRVHNHYNSNIQVTDWSEAYNNKMYPKRSRKKGEVEEAGQEEAPEVGEGGEVRGQPTS